METEKTYNGHTLAAILDAQRRVSEFYGSTVPEAVRVLLEAVPALAEAVTPGTASCNLDGMGIVIDEAAMLAAVEDFLAKAVPHVSHIGRPSCDLPCDAAIMEARRVVGAVGEEDRFKALEAVVEMLAQDVQPLIRYPKYDTETCREIKESVHRLLELRRVLS